MTWIAYIGKSETTINDKDLPQLLEELEKKNYHIEAYTDEYHIDDADGNRIGRIIPKDDQKMDVIYGRKVLTCRCGSHDFKVVAFPDGVATVCLKCDNEIPLSKVLSMLQED